MLETMLNGSLVEVRDLDAEWLLDFAADAEVRERQAGRAKLRAAAQWCVLHPATAESGFVTWSDTGLPGLCPDEEAALGGEGTRWWRVHPGTVRGRTRGVHPDRVAVVGRRPGPPTPTPPPLGRRRSVGGGAVEGPQDRPGHPQPLEAAAASVDGQLADRIGSCGWRAIEFAVAQAIATYDPHLLETREKQGKDAWGVRLFHRGVCTDGADDWVGTSHLEVTGDTLDLTTFHDLVCEQAAQLKALGDTDTLEVRKAKAVGVIANRQAALNLGTLLGLAGRSPDRRRWKRCRSLAKTKLYLHLSLTDLLGPKAPTAATDRVRDRGEVRAGHHRPDQGLGRPVPGHHPTRPRHGPHRRRRSPTTHPPGCASWSSSAIGTVFSRGATGTPEPATWTTSPPTRTTAHRPDPARRPRRLRRCTTGRSLPPMALPPHPSRPLPLDNPTARHTSSPRPEPSPS